MTKVDIDSILLNVKQLLRNFRNYMTKIPGFFSDKKKFCIHFMTDLYVKKKG